MNPNPLRGKTTLYADGFPCPKCGQMLNGASNPGMHTPKKGDKSVCSRCVSVLVYEDPPVVRLATQEDLDAMDEEGRESLNLAIGQVEKMKADTEDLLVTMMEIAQRDLEYLKRVNYDGCEEANIQNVEERIRKIQFRLTQEFMR